MSREYKEKLGTLRGVRKWQKLDSAGDVKRFLAWCIHSVRDQTLNPKTAAIMGQLGAFLLKAVEVADFEHRLEHVEKLLEERNASDTGNATTTH
jgi:hypothetical protein